MLAGPALGAAPYYEGKTIEVIIPFPVAGGTDIWIRTIAPYLEKNIPGNPKFTFRNIGGGRGIPGMMEFALKAKPDGHMTLVSSATNYFPVLLGDKAAKYDFVSGNRAGQSGGRRDVCFSGLGHQASRGSAKPKISSMAVSAPLGWI